MYDKHGHSIRYSLSVFPTINRCEVYFQIISQLALWEPKLATEFYYWIREVHDEPLSLLHSITYANQEYENPTESLLIKIVTISSNEQSW